jgi:indole-3-glycerol phosphate synthase
MSARAQNVLERILAQTREELARRKRELPLALLAERAAAAQSRRSAAAPSGGSSGQGDFREALAAPGIAVIAEFKRRSPSAGTLSESPDLATTVAAYERGGAAAVSVLTEGPNFAGSLDDLSAARAACGLPLLRKDFILDVYQLHEALAAGADAVLLIVAALEAGELAALHAQARALGLDVLVEVHDREQLDVALGLGAEIVGVNNRDLRDFSVQVERTESLMEEIPADVLVVSESGIGAAEQLQRLERRGVAAVLVGESLMRAHDPAAALRRLRSRS